MSDFHEMLLEASWILQKLKKLFTNNKKNIDPFFSYPPKKENNF